jgi:uncharacterized damage-inducible protein DinB
MSLNTSLLAEFDHEMATTRRLLERVTDQSLSWTPHAKSMDMARLASHVAELPNWTATTITTDELDMNPPGGPGYQPTVFKEAQAILDTFDKGVAEAKAALEGATDEVLFGNWSLKNGGQTLFTMPKIACLRTWCFNHIIHHRGQLSVYLRLNDIPVPSIYGPSADEGGM